MQEEAVHTKDYPIGISDADLKRELKLSALFNFYQESATLAGEALGLGMGAMEKHGVAWILTRVRTEIVEPSHWGKVITVETWAQPPGRLESERDYLARDCNGQLVAKAISGWVLMDTKKRRIRRPDFLDYTFPVVNRQRPFAGPVQRLKSQEHLQAAYKRTIAYSDVDIHGHLNNTRYVDFALDCFPIEVHKEYRVSALDINFVNEALPGDSITLYKGCVSEAKGKYYVEGLRGSDERVLFRALLRLSPR